MNTFMIKDVNEIVRSKSLERCVEQYNRFNQAVFSTAWFSHFGTDMDKHDFIRFVTAELTGVIYKPCNQYKESAVPATGTLMGTTLHYFSTIEPFTVATDYRFVEDHDKYAFSINKNFWKIISEFTFACDRTHFYPVPVKYEGTNETLKELYSALSRPNMDTAKEVVYLNLTPLVDKSETIDMFYDNLCRYKALCDSYVSYFGKKNAIIAISYDKLEQVAEKYGNLNGHKAYGFLNNTIDATSRMVACSDAIYNETRKERYK